VNPRIRFFGRGIHPPCPQFLARWCICSDRATLVEAAALSPYDRKILRLAFLAPDIQRDILAGLQPRGLNLERLQKTTIPLTWSGQRKALGWPS